MAFGKIAAQANSAAGWGAEKMTKYFNPVVLALIELLKKAMPECDEETIFWGYHFVSGAMTHNMARTGRLDDLSGGRCSSADFESIKRHMARFMAAGFQALAQNRLKKAMPGCDEKTIFWGYHFLSGAMTHNMARTERLDDLSGRRCSSADFESIKLHMARFMAAGFQALAERVPRTCSKDI